MTAQPGLVVLFGSGETLAAGQKVFDWLFRQLAAPLRVAILETPAGFELNSERVAGRIGEFLEQHLRNYQPAVTLVPARRRGTPFSPDLSEIAGQIVGADVSFLGPGSPTYAVRQLRDSLTWHTLLATHRLGAAVVLASAAVVAAGSYTLPVYEIYKAGQDLHWQAGLAFFEPYGLDLALVPHWNNRDGGGELDTSRCYMGRERFEKLLELLPPGTLVVGIDELTALAVDLAGAVCHVLGQGGVTLLAGGNERYFETGSDLALAELGAAHLPPPDLGLPAGLLESTRERMGSAGATAVASARVRCLLDERETARARRDWVAADGLRDEILALGWRILDTPAGPRLEAAD
ncbi:MAG TPA: cysteinyl-tRNA synthetase [Anaerolineae bacterium]|nr:cysteinyl-tRNA synthetase [Anaerolineae bacterium]